VWQLPAMLAQGDMPERVIELFREPFSVAPSARPFLNVDTEAFDQLIDRIGVRISYSPKEYPIRPKNVFFTRTIPP